tara:strand:+ start:2127 stop:3050 length:924 start_codon:yes stop_codon:yes gene_type:complete
MKIIKLLILSVFVSTVSCKSKIDKITKKKTQKIEVHGHRGERGNLPENSIEAFLGALHKGVDVLELDIVISKDRKVVVSHEPFMSSVYMSKPSGKPINKDEEKNFNLYQMDYDSIKTFDGGSRGNYKFPQQQKLKTYKPLLSEVFNVIETEIKNNNLKQVKYNIEIKSVEDVYDVYQPQPDDFVNLVMQIIVEKNMEHRVNIQSFDPTILNILHKKYPEIEIAYLVSKGSIQNNLKHLDFKPNIYSPNFKLISNQQSVDSLKAMVIKVIPWIVNEEADIKQQMQLQVDGIITDYPERVIIQCKNIIQ